MLIGGAWGGRGTCGPVNIIVSVPIPNSKWRTMRDYLLPLFLVPDHIDPDDPLDLQPGHELQQDLLFLRLHGIQDHLLCQRSRRIHGGEDLACCHSVGTQVFGFTNVPCKDRRSNEISISAAMSQAGLRDRI